LKTNYGSLKRLQIKHQSDQVNVLVDIDKVSVTYANGTIALSDISMTIKPGEFVSIIGPSGCGKSTLLRAIAGLGSKSAGTITWPHLSMGERGRPQDIAIVFQEPTLLPWKDVFSNVYLPLKLRGISKAAAHSPVMDALTAVGMQDFINAYPRELSGGMSMRVSIARSLVTRPTLLLMDEPFGALDEIARQKLNEDLLDLQKTAGITIVFVTHSIFEAAYLASRVVVMRSTPGRIHADVPLASGMMRQPRDRASVSYQKVCAEVSRLLADAMEGDAIDEES
jgi:NitT/TauT family transport system ATP-binding protein